MSAQDLPVELRRALSAIARTPRLLVASDYDGTLAPIVSDPQKAFPHPESVRALRALAGLTATIVAGYAHASVPVRMHGAGPVMVAGDADGLGSSYMSAGGSSSGGGGGSSGLQYSGPRSRGCGARKE